MINIFIMFLNVFLFFSRFNVLNVFKIFLRHFYIYDKVCMGRD